MESAPYILVLIIFTAAGPRDCGAEKREITLLSSRGERKENSFSRVTHDSEVERRRLRTDLDLKKDRANELEETKIATLFKRAQTETDDGSKGVAAPESLQEIQEALKLQAQQLKTLQASISRNEKLIMTLSDCGPHKEISNGKVSGDTFIGGTPVISCDPGYSKTGSAQCKGLLTWETDVKCQKDCATLNVANGIVYPDTSVPHGTTVTVECERDYGLDGNNTTVCDNGVFHDVPWCRRSHVLTDMQIGRSRRFNMKFGGDTEDHALISGAEFMSNGQLVLCDYRNNRLNLLKSDFTVIQSLNLTSSPWDISAVNSTSVIITLPGLLTRQLQYVHVQEGLHLSSTIQMEKSCWGVNVKGTEIFTSCHQYKEGEIIVLDMTGTVKRRIGVIDQQEKSFLLTTPYYVTASAYTGNIYVGDWDTDTVTCFSSNGDVVYQYTDPGMYRPNGIYIDSVDNIIVCGKTSFTCQIITEDGKKDKTLLTSDDGLEYPYAVNYRKRDSTLVVGGWNNDYLLVFTLTN